MTIKDPAPGAHNHVAGVPDESFAYVADPDADPEALRSIAADMAELADVQSRSLREFFDREARTITVRVYYKGPGNPRAAVESALRQWSPKVFEAEVLDA